MKKSPFTVGIAINQIQGYVSPGTIAQMKLSKDEEIRIRNDGSRAYFEVLKKTEHHPIEINRQ